jgi:hypothetical protein
MFRDDSLNRRYRQVIRSTARVDEAVMLSYGER